MKQEERANQKKILESVPGLITVYNIHSGKFIYINDSIKKILGYSKNKFPLGGVSLITSLVHPEDRKRLLEGNAAALKKANTNAHKEVKNEPIVTFEYRIKHKNGSWRWLKTDGVIYGRDKNGKVEYVMNISIDITERKEAELKESEQWKITQEILKKSEERYRFALEAGKIGVWEWDIQKNSIYWSDRVYEFYGTSPKKFDVTYENFRKQLHPDDKKIAEKEIKMAIDGIKDYDITYRIITLQGETRWITSRALVTRDSLGIPQYMLGATLDITEQKIIEEAVRRREKHFRALADNVPNLVWIAHADGYIFWYNSRWYKYTGTKPKQMEGGGWQLVLDVTTLPQVLKVWTRSIKNGKPFEMVFSLKGADGVYRPFLTKVVPIKNDKGKIIQWFGTNTDISKQKDVEDKLKDSKAKFVLLAEASKMLSSSLDYQKTLQNVTNLAIKYLSTWCFVDIIRNDGTVELIAVAHKNQKEVKRVKQYRNLHPIDMNAKIGVPKVLKTGTSEYYPIITDKMLVVNLKNEEELQFARSLEITSIMIVPLCLKNKCIGAMTFIATDIHKHYTKDDLAIAEDLANRSVMAIENAQLYTKAQSAITLRDEFISVVSHELKTPLTSLKLYTQVLQKELLNSKSTKLFSKLDEQINNLSVLINDLLNASKLQHGKLEFNNEEIDLNEVLREAVEDIQKTDKKHIIIVKGKIIKSIYADRYRIYQVITNLLTNAIKYSPDATKVIVQLTPEKEIARVSVRDFGIGINKEDQKIIFNQFYRITSPERKIFPGFGMGLYIANEIIRRYCGKMHVKSTKGKGAVFSFILPYKKNNNFYPTEDA
ncbi:MAG TPA: PAS domain-containing protein [Candidatus Sulfotelmatobacter sp.]|jgi:PAS domain S-box-containing protein|nr:PAS domain-containing protein [Candidatus Sulfotelmatobacter sp.]